ncbi:MAG TPA: hypothetical protein VL334_05540 [Anaerolineae bacterium]|nr:hypothetical protein [Anaerolineae bacterium]
MNHKNDGSVFRTKAMQRYAQSRERTVFPRFISPRVFPYFWILVGLLLASMVVVWWVEIPFYTSAVGLVIDGAKFPEVSDQVALAVFVPSESHLELHEGQDVLVQFGQTSERFSRTIIAVESQIISPEAARQQFDLNDGSSALITHPIAIAIVQIQPIPGDYPPLAYLGSTYRVDLSAGSRRLITLLPIIGPLFLDRP